MESDDLWRTTFLTLKHQFQTAAAKSNGLYHTFLEVSEGERRDYHLPPFVEEMSAARERGGFIPDPKWVMTFSSGVPVHRSTFRAFKSGDECLFGQMWNGQEVVFRDRSGKPQAVFQKAPSRHGAFCGDSAAFQQFKTLGTAAGKALLSLPPALEALLPPDIQQSIHPPKYVTRYVFGNVRSNPPYTPAGWAAVMFAEDDGLIIYSPDDVSRDDLGEWTLVLHALSWLHRHGSPLTGARWFWEGNLSVQMRGGGVATLGPWKVPTTASYSVIGEKENPTDVFLASVWAIDLLIHLAEQALKSGHDLLDRKESGTHRGELIDPAYLDAFREIADAHKVANVKLPLKRAEDDIRRDFENLLGEQFHAKDSGSESCDLYTLQGSHNRQQCSVAAMFKGPGNKKWPLQVSGCGKNGNQVVRLFEVPADIYIVQANGPFDPTLVKHIQVTADGHATRGARTIRYMLIDGITTARILAITD